LVALNSCLLLLDCSDGPRHSWGVMRDAKAALGVQQDHSAVSVDPLLQIIHRFESHPLRQVAGFNTIGGPLGKDELHQRLSPPSGGCGCTLIVRIATAPD